MKNFKSVLFVALFFISATILGQTKISGTVVDETGEPLPGASVVEKGTTNGTATDFDGKFMLNTKSNSGSVVISFIGYANKQVSFAKAGDIGKVQLATDGNVLEEVVIKGLVDVAKDRKTPVAVSTIKAAEIQEKLGSQEFPEILNNTPSVYATKSGGGFGDARINIRGFDQENIAVLINGVPVNDMENSRVYWSNWAGLSDVTTAMQVQRGLGSSKLAISSVGGTINVITKTTDKQEGGSILGSIGNDIYHKTLATYSTGKNDNGFAASFLLSRTAGDGYVDGTKFEGYNYFVGLGWELNEAHDLQFMLTGAPQVHNQRTTNFFNMGSLSDYLKYGKKYNLTHGYLNGKEFNWRRNFYHKPVVSLNWNWDINDKSSLSASAYVSFGRGGGTGDIGYLHLKDASGNEVLVPDRDDPTKSNPIKKYASNSMYRDSNGLVEWDKIVRYNQGEAVMFGSGLYQRDNDGGINDRGNNGLTRRASINAHNWFGVLANYNTSLSEAFTLDFGIDLRDYTGEHYRRIDNLLGANGFEVQKDNNNPNKVYNVENSSNLSSLWNVFKSSDDEEKIDYHNDGKVRWYGAFTQLEYSKDAVSAFVQGGVSNQGFKRIDYFNYLDSDPEQETDWQNFLGGNIKGGVNWNIDEKHNVFANTGYYSKQPFFDAIFLNYKNDINSDVVNEKILGFEVGYGYSTPNLKANVNLYRTKWSDRFIRIDYESPTNDEGAANLTGATQVHMGGELDLKYDVAENIKLLGMFSYGDWKYEGSLSGNAFDQNQNKIGEVDIDIDGIAVGNSPQMVASLGLEVEPFKNFKVDYTHRFNDKLYSALVLKEGEEGSIKDDGTLRNGPIELPSYSIGDLGISYKLLFNEGSKEGLNFRLNFNNVFDTEYIAESATNYTPRPGDETYKGIATGNKVFFGFGRTWNFSVRYNF